MARNFENQVAMVTGAGSGIGRSAALLFARRGAKVVVADITADGGEETVQMIRDQGGESLFVQADVSKAADVEALIKKTVKTYGRLDCAFNNAGVPNRIYAPLAEQPEEEFDRVISVNLKGVFLCMKYEIPQMLKQGGGSIVVTASISSLRASPLGLSPYCTSKHGVLGLVKSAVAEYAAAGIRVNAVCPGYTLTPMLVNAIKANPELEVQMKEKVPAGRLAFPEDIAEMAVWLCSDEASYVMGEIIAVDGGSMVV
jgi:NAD(P)-dependent dehydrogenase (short-subunit alcohol dehydrogenase family)